MPKLGIPMPPKSEDIMLVLELELDEEERRKTALRRSPCSSLPCSCCPSSCSSCHPCQGLASACPLPACCPSAAFPHHGWHASHHGHVTPRHHGGGGRGRAAGLEAGDGRSVRGLCRCCDALVARLLVLLHRRAILGDKGL